MEKEIGTVIHWYDKISVAVIKLTGGSLKKGDAIVVRRGENEFEDTVASLQIDHKDVEEAKKGDEVAVKLSQQAKGGAMIYPKEE